MGRASRDGVVSISIDYKKELNQMIQDFESTMTEASSNGNLSKGMKKQFDDAIAELKEFKANMEKSFAELNLKGIVDKDTFKSYKDRVKQNFDSVRETIDGLNLTIGNLNSKVEILGGGLDISKISNQFKDFQDYVQNTHNAIDAMIKELGGQGVSLMSFDQASINSAIDGVKKLENAIKTIDSNSYDEYDLKILDLNEEELQKEVNSISATIEHLKGSMDSLKKDMANPNVGGIQLTKMKAEYEALSLEMKNAYDKMETILNSENLKFPVPDFSATAVGLEEVAEYEDDIEKFVERAKLAKKELQSIIDSTKRPSAKVSDKLDPNSAQVVAGVTIETTSSELWKILSPILDNLQDDLNSNPVVAPVKLVVAPTAVSSEKTGEVGGITKNYSKKYQKVLAETGEDAIIDLEGVYKKTFTSIMDEAVSYAKETIEKIQNIFESTPIDVKFNMSQEELDKIQNFVLSNKDGKAIDISGQVTKTKTEVKELAEGLEKVKEILSSTNGKKVSFEGFDKFQEDISSSLAQLVEFKDMLQTLQSMESILSKATGISGTTELTTQWELVSKLITNAIKLDGTFRKNANIGKVAYEYNKYLNMGGTNEISSIDKVAKLEDGANIINTILAKVKELNSQKVDTGSVDKADDELKSVSSTLDDVISRLDHLVNLTRDIGNTFYKMFKEASISDVDKQWSAIESKFKSIAGESGKINLSKQKKDVQELMEMYQKYSNAGGMKTPFDLTDNAETIKKLNKVYEQINFGSGDTSVSKGSKGFETVKKSVDDLTTSINIKTGAIKTEVNTMELAARAEVKSIQKIIDALTPLIEKIKSIPELKIPKAENVDSVGSLDSGNSTKPNSIGTSPVVDNKTNISSGSTPVAEQQNKLQEELKETRMEAEETAKAINSVSNPNIKQYNNNVKFGLDRVKKAQILRENGIAPGRDLLLTDKGIWSELKKSGFLKPDMSSLSEEEIRTACNDWGDALVSKISEYVSQKIRNAGFKDNFEFTDQLYDIENAKHSNWEHSSNNMGWTFFNTKGYKNVPKDEKAFDYKIYAAFEDVAKLNKETIQMLFKALSEAGYVGGLKTARLSDSAGQTDQIVLHGRNAKDQEIAYRVLQEFSNQTGIKLGYLGGGFDTTRNGTKINLGDEVFSTTKGRSFSAMIEQGLDEYLARFFKITPSFTQENSASSLNSTSSGIEEQNKLQEELRETEVQAGQTAQAVREVTSQDQMKDAFQGDNGTNATNLVDRLKSIFTDTKELNSIIEAFNTGGYFSFNIFENEGIYDRVNELRNVLNEYGYTFKNFKEDTEALSISGQIVSLEQENAALDENIQKRNERKKVSTQDSSTVDNGTTTSIRNETSALDANTKAAKENADAKKQIAQAEDNTTYFSDEKGAKNYWQGRFKETLSDLTNCNAELKQMGEYYKALEQSTAADNKTFTKKQTGLVNKLNPYTDETKYTAEFVQRTNDLIKQINDVKFIDSQSISQIEEFDENVKDIVNASKLLENRIVKQKSRIDELVADMKQYAAQNTNMSSSQKMSLDSITKEAEQLSKSGIASGKQIDDLRSKFAQLKGEVSETNKTGKSFFDQIGNRLADANAKFIAQFFSWQDWIRYIRQAAEAVIELNTNITELAKVSEQTTKQIYSDFDSYADIAKKMGATISDTISATADWSRNGYNIPDSKELAEVALLYKNVGDGIDIDSANESLISTLQGFELEADQAEHIIDVFNEVSNNEAISSSGIGEALQNSAAAFNAANTSLEESVALVSATNSVLQDPSKVGDAHIADLYSNVMKIKSSYIG